MSRPNVPMFWNGCRAIEAPWGAVTHMYEIGRAPENASHPDFALAEELARGFWASLPLLDGQTLAMLLARARDCKGAERQGAR